MSVELLLSSVGQHELDGSQYENYVALKRKRTTLGIILLFVNIGDLKIEFWFEIVGNLSEELLLGKTFLDLFIHVIFSGDTGMRV